MHDDLNYYYFSPALMVSGPLDGFWSYRVYRLGLFLSSGSFQYRSKASAVRAARRKVLRLYRERLAS